MPGRHFFTDKQRAGDHNRKSRAASAVESPATVIEVYSVGVYGPTNLAVRPADASAHMASSPFRLESARQLPPRLDSMQLAEDRLESQLIPRPGQRDFLLEAPQDTGQSPSAVRAVP